MASQRPSDPAGTAHNTTERGQRTIVAAALVTALVAVVVVASLLLSRQSASGGASLASPTPDPGFAHVHGLGVDPGDGTLYAATHHGVFAIPEQGKAKRIGNHHQDTMGFTIVGPKHFLASGHPSERENLPNPLGLIESTDGGKTWKSLSLSGEVDFHALAVGHGRVYGFDSGTSQLLASTDRVHWDRRAGLPLADVALSPSNTDTLLATTEQGLARSSDAGRSFAIVRGAPVLVVLAWPAEQTLFGIAPDGTVHLSTNGGTTWQARGRLDGPPEAITAVNATTVYAATKTGIYASANGGKTFTLRYRD